MNSVTLLAKSRGAKGSPTGSPPTVASHCKDVRNAGIAVWDAVENDLAASLGSDRGKLCRELRPIFLLAALVHDIGKANSAFQEMVQNPGAGGKRQPIRHEILSAIFLRREELLGQWLAEHLSDDDSWALIWAVAGHHLKIREQRDQERENPLFRTAGTPKSVTLHLGHDQVKDLLGSVHALIGGNGPKPKAPLKIGDMSLSAMEGDLDGLETWVSDLVRESRRAWKALKPDEDFRLRLALLKALVIAADVAGSALVGDAQRPETWIPEKLATRVTPEALEPVIRDNLKRKPPRRFQDRVAVSANDATVVMAGCGNGKTTAAYMWAQKWAKGRKLFFAYPTTGTASAGYEDYLLAQDQLVRDLIHGRAWVDLRAMRDCPDDDPTETANRLESLSAWGCQVIACTVDTILGLIQNQSRPLFSFPAIACGAFVFDEVHSYDRRLFAELLIFLRTFPGAPVLLMSASIPPGRLTAIREVLGDRMGDVIKGDKSQETIKRYRIEMRASAEDCWADVKKAIASESNNKVLWVCNTVGGAQEILNEARARGIEEKFLILYHSRFRYQDRVERQKQVLTAFDEDSPDPCLAITTQVCEMSLDISANLLVTALAPLPSLVQRLGRLNRRATRPDPWPCLVYPFAGKPYDGKESLRQLEASREMIGKMGGKPYSQARLARYLEAMGFDEPESPARKEEELYSAWLEGGWQSEPLPAREGDTSLTVILEEDIQKIRQATGMSDPTKWNARNLVPWTVPILARSFRGADRRAGPYPVAPKGSIDYDETEGVR